MQGKHGCCCCCQKSTSVLLGWRGRKTREKEERIFADVHTLFSGRHILALVDVI